jgi:hypothetical protein
VALDTKIKERCVKKVDAQKSSRREIDIVMYLKEIGKTR